MCVLSESTLSFFIGIIQKRKKYIYNVSDNFISKLLLHDHTLRSVVLTRVVSISFDDMFTCILTATDASRCDKQHIT